MRRAGLAWILESDHTPPWNRIPANEFLRRTEATKLDGASPIERGQLSHQGDEIRTRVLKEMGDSLERGSGRYIRSVQKVSMPARNADQVYRAEHFDPSKTDKPSEFLGLPSHFRDSIEYSETREVLWVHRKIEDEYGDIDWKGRLFVLEDDGDDRWKGWELTPRPYARSKIEMLFRQVIGCPVSARLELDGEQEARIEFEDLFPRDIQGTLRTWFSLISAFERGENNGVASYRIPVEALTVSKEILRGHGVKLKGV